MGLRLKFNLVLILVFLAGFGAAGLISRQLLQDNARDEVVRNARLMMEAATSVRTYTINQIQPHLIKQLEEVFLPQTVPAYAATEAINQLQKKYPDYSYKEATLNPTNPRDRAADWEADIVQQFRQHADLKELVSERQSSTGRSLFIAKPIQITNPACLQCHTTAAMAPPTMIKVYGEANGFGWKLNEIVGAQVVTVPMEIPIRNADRAFTTFMASLLSAARGGGLRLGFSSPLSGELVGVTGIEPVTPSMSTKCSPAELRVQAKALSSGERRYTGEARPAQPRNGVSPTQ